MENPFFKRATEHVRNDLAYLAIVSPQPIDRYLTTYAASGALYDRTVVVCGTPGSGKSTLARLFEFPSINALLNVGFNRGGDEPFQDLAASLAAAHALDAGDRPLIVGCRLLMESDYRGFWESGYPDKLKMNLMTALLQARCVLTWLRHLQAAGLPLDEVTVVARAGAVASVDAIGGVTAAGVIARAREVEYAIYRIVGALVPPDVNTLDSAATSAYQPFDVIEALQIPWRGVRLKLLPLAIFDDAHDLHIDQLRQLLQWLARRELRIARWILTRFDIYDPREALASVEGDSDRRSVPPLGLKAERDVLLIYLQGTGRDRAKRKREFRRMARDMASRYLRQWPLFADRGLRSFSHLLGSRLPAVLNKAEAQHVRLTDRAQARLKISKERREMLCQAVQSYLANGEGADIADSADVREAMVRILMHRVISRARGRSLFDDIEPGAGRPVVPNADVYDAACLYLLHKHRRPYYFGINKLADAGTENAEQFLHLAGALAERSATQLVRGEEAILSPRTQNERLRERAKEMIIAWNFPRVTEIRRLVRVIGVRCQRATLRPNAPVLPNAYGILQSEFDDDVIGDRQLSEILKYAVARNAISLKTDYSCKGRVWCLLELGGLAILRYGLTLDRGGFIEGSVQGLRKMLEGQNR